MSSSVVQRDSQYSISRYPDIQSPGHHPHCRAPRGHVHAQDTRDRLRRAAEGEQKAAMVGGKSAPPQLAPTAASGCVGVCKFHASPPAAGRPVDDPNEQNGRWRRDAQRPHLEACARVELQRSRSIKFTAEMAQPRYQPRDSRFAGLAARCPMCC